MGNKNMKYGNGKRANAPDDIFNEQELNLVSKETGSHKRDQLALLNQKVKQFEVRVAREEQLMRNRDGAGSGEEILEAQTQVNDQYIKAIEAKLKILDKL